MAAWIDHLISGGSRQNFGYGSSRVPFVVAPNKLVLHTTEGTSFPGYVGGASAPHITIHPKLKQARQHFPLDSGARALRDGGVGANTQGTLQVEIVYFAKDTPSMTEDELAYIAHVLSVMCEQAGVEVRCSLDFKDSRGAYGTKSSTRMTEAQFKGYRGILGHQHVPGNTHWDPGVFPIDKLIALMGGGYVPPATPTTPPTQEESLVQKLPTLDWRKNVTKPNADPTIDKYNKRMQGLLAATGDYNGKIDGIHGPLSQKGLSALQVRTNSGDGRGNADLVAGENTWAAALGLR